MGNNVIVEYIKHDLCKRSNQSCHDENKTDIIGNSNQKENSKYSMAVNNIDHIRLLYIE